MKRPEKSEVRKATEAGQADEQFAKKYPTILQYLLDDKWDDGKERETSALAVSLKDGMWQAALNDKALKQSFYSSAATLPQALALMEKALVDGVDAWRSWKKGK